MKDINKVGPGYYHSGECNLADFKKIIDQLGDLEDLTTTQGNFLVKLGIKDRLININIFIKIKGAVNVR